MGILLGGNMKFLSTASLLAATLVAGQVTSAHGAKADFETCDGLRAPGSKGDGMTSAPSDFYGFRGRIPTNWVAQIAACDRALTDPKLLPTQTLRKVNLLRARALGHFGKGDHDKALTEIDAAEVAGAALSTDPLYARSMAISFALARAAIWTAKEDATKASGFAQVAASARPYSNRVQAVVASILRQNPIEGLKGASPFARLLPLAPESVSDQFSYLINNSRFDLAVKQFPRLKPEFPKIGGSVLFGDAFTPVEEKLLRSLIVSLEGAYAFAATGDVTRAKAILAETRTKFDEALQPVVRPDGVAAPPSRIQDALKNFVAQWAMLVEGRIAVNEKRPTDALKAIVGQAVPVSSAGVDLLSALRTALPETQRALAPDPDALKTKLVEQRKENAINVEALQRALPAPETSNRITDYKKSSKPLLSRLLLVGKAYAPDGFRSKTDAATGITTVEYLGAQASAPVVEELTLLHAADLARKQSKAGFLIIARRDFSRTISTTRGYSSTPISSRPAGFKTEMDVQFVDPANIPAALTSEADRLLIADQVYANLAPIYITAP
jgi:hypothetical protein